MYFQDMTFGEHIHNQKSNLSDYEWNLKQALQNGTEIGTLQKSKVLSVSWHLHNWEFAEMILNQGIDDVVVNSCGPAVVYGALQYLDLGKRCDIEFEMKHELQSEGIKTNLSGALSRWIIKNWIRKLNPLVLNNQMNDEDKRGYWKSIIKILHCPSSAFPFTEFARDIFGNRGSKSLKDSSEQYQKQTKSVWEDNSSSWNAYSNENSSEVKEPTENLWTVEESTAEEPLVVRGLFDTETESSESDEEGWLSETQGNLSTYDVKFSDMVFTLRQTLKNMSYYADGNNIPPEVSNFIMPFLAVGKESGLTVDNSVWGKADSTELEHRLENAKHYC
eukprot:TRINITY_DN6828_c0_g1_i1.p1 TRINITY_DN6828_c0_g1~~TRINITY_DN6828_c0_g1_i1.p1  ORF type:complete len:333 (-),score=69.92 TRINITY_DN6828_c0_g1_i1:60-1058(-)